MKDKRVKVLEVIVFTPSLARERKTNEPLLADEDDGVRVQALVELLNVGAVVSCAGKFVGE